MDGSWNRIKAALVILVVSFPIMINEVSAIRSIEDNVYNLMKVLKASKWQTFCKIEVPYSIEMMLSGIKLAPNAGDDRRGHR